MVVVSFVCVDHCLSFVVCVCVFCVCSECLCVCFVLVDSSPRCKLCLRIPVWLCALFAHMVVVCKVDHVAPGCSCLMWLFDVVSLFVRCVVCVCSDVCTCARSHVSVRVSHDYLLVSFLCCLLGFPMLFKCSVL